MELSAYYRNPSEEDIANKLHFLLDITDYSPGGLPTLAIKYLQVNIGPHKCIDERVDIGPDHSDEISKGRSSRTGLPHIVELYHQLTATGGNDFDMSVTTRDSGTSFRMRFELLFVAPTPTSPAHNLSKQNPQLTGFFVSSSFTSSSHCV